MFSKKKKKKKKKKNAEINWKACSLRIRQYVPEQACYVTSRHNVDEDLKPISRISTWSQLGSSCCSGTGIAFFVLLIYFVCFFFAVVVFDVLLLFFFPCCFNSIQSIGYPWIATQLWDYLYNGIQTGKWEIVMWRWWHRVWFTRGCCRVFFFFWFF